ncbi:unnamed protein product [Scytosiphon promiscuus]
MRLPLKFGVALLPRCCWVAGFHVALSPSIMIETTSQGDHFRSSFSQRSHGTATTPFAVGIKKEEEGMEQGQYLSLTKLTRCPQLLLGGWAALLGSAYLGANQDQRSYRPRKRGPSGPSPAVMQLSSGRSCRRFHAHLLV